MTQQQAVRLKILAIGAHPDDCDLKVGGTAALYRQGGHEVCFVSVTDGRNGHQTRFGDDIAAERAREASRAAAVLGLDYRILGFPDGGLQPTLEARDEIIRLIRGYRPDLVLTHRPNDYHPDHRYTSQLVCDAAYLLTVPGVVQDLPALRADPVIMYLADDFQFPCPLAPSIVVDLTPVADRVVEMLACHRSQVFDWLPYNRGVLDQVPRDPDRRRDWLRDWYLESARSLAKRFHERIVADYGRQRAAEVECIEAFQLCEYGSPLTQASRRRLFPFVPLPEGQPT